MTGDEGVKRFNSWEMSSDDAEDLRIYGSISTNTLTLSQASEWNG